MSNVHWGLSWAVTRHAMCWLSSSSHKGVYWSSFQRNYYLKYIQAVLECFRPLLDVMLYKISYCVLDQICSNCIKTSDLWFAGTLCGNAFCHLYWGCSRAGCHGCLAKFRGRFLAHLAILQHLYSAASYKALIATSCKALLRRRKVILVWPTSWTPAVGGLIVCEWVSVCFCVSAEFNELLNSTERFIAKHWKG